MTITYDVYADGRFLYRNTYVPQDKEDYERAMRLFEEERETYKMVSIEKENIRMVDN